jgi:hypothetical protein
MRGSTLVALYEVVQKFGYWGDTADQQMIPSAGTGHVEQVPLGVVDFLQVGVITDRLNTLLQGNYFVITSHNDHRAKFQTFGEVHGADRYVAAGGFYVFIENLESNACFLYGSARDPIVLPTGRTRRTRAEARRPWRALRSNWRPT